MTQCQQILAYMKEHGSITPREAVSELNCYRLAARISDLRSIGVKILTKTEKGNGTMYARYFLT